jgi:hypothetical protein
VNIVNTDQEAKDGAEADDVSVALIAPFQPDEANRKFWFRSLEASWRFETVNSGDIPGSLDWGYLYWMANVHRVLEDMIRVWEPVPDIPESLQHEFWFHANKAERLGRPIEEGMAYLDQVSGDTGIPVVIMKSPAYVGDAFGSYKYREVRDLDILSRPSDFQRLSDRLEKDGFSVQDLRNQRVFSRDDFRIEFHHQALSRRRHKNLLPVVELLERAVPLHSTRNLLRLADLDEIVLIALHARNHDFRRYMWLRDIPAWWRVRNPDPDTVFQCFKELGVERTGWITWRGMEQLGWKIPDSWSPGEWGISPTFDRCIQDFWNALANDTGVTLPVELGWRRVEFREGRGLIGKIETVGPWFAWRRIVQIKMAAHASRHKIVQAYAN